MTCQCGAKGAAGPKMPKLHQGVSRKKTGEKERRSSWGKLLELTLERQIHVLP
jgi:hypothetical protein